MQKSMISFYQNCEWRAEGANMNEQDFEKIKEIKENREYWDIVEKIMKLQRQIECPDRNGMIDALRDAQQIAPLEITQTIQSQGGNISIKPWSDVSDRELYYLLSQYKQGLVNHGIIKAGRSGFELMLKLAMQAT